MLQGQPMLLLLCEKGALALALFPHFVELHRALNAYGLKHTQ